MELSTEVGPPRDWRDPSILTTQQLIREIGAVREIMEALLKGLDEKYAARLTGMDRAVAQLESVFSQFRSDVASQVARLQELHDEKFRSIAIQFAERDTRTEQTSRDSKVAVDAALQAAKEAVGEQNRSSALAIAKSEAATDKRIDQIVTLFQTATGATNDKIDDLKSRVMLIEGKGVGQVTAQTHQTATSGNIVSVIAVVVSIAALVTGVVLAIALKT